MRIAPFQSPDPGHGLAIAAAGARPRPNPLLNVAALAIGGFLAYRGATGFCPIRSRLT